ncbi:hypothetical protein A3770_18p80980 [Chloropicon primus]|uniref:DUF4200 domain-containing protein n=1 Tax=Chloropicon primus TaxID=1764295 RepID=A0A5B8N177_9CHLO|nr:hypothetical protein A3770_18p80980 [Chloropicon primus]|eukprot:QDZ25580.1 hypothetical protein A3770_18p80980 [Chloropicon primus]
MESGTLMTNVGQPSPPRADSRTSDDAPVLVPNDNSATSLENVVSQDSLKGAGVQGAADLGPSGDAQAHKQFPTIKPFQMPSDDDLFTLREQEREMKRMERQRNKNLQVQDKTTFSSRMSRTCPSDKSMNTIVNPSGTATGAAGMKPVGTTGGQFGKSGLSGATSQQLVSQRTRLERENMSDFIAKKREIFLVQMSLDTKRAEIRKLEERALQREEALRRSESMLEEDKLRFEEFLRENDEKVKEAITKAEVETKAKQDKVNEIKRLNAAIATLRSELNKYEEQLEDCRKYKQFLDYLTPSEWFEQQDEKRKELIEKRQKAFKEKLEAWDEDQRKAMEAVTAAEQLLEKARTQQEVDMNEKALSRARESLAEAQKAPKPVQPTSYLTDEEEEQLSSEMHFKHPQQLLDIFAQLEEQNLFLIQNCQETEEALEELKTKYRETKQQMDAEIKGLDSQISSLESSIGVEEEKSRLLRSLTDGTESKTSVANGKTSEGTSLEALSAKVSEVYVRCGFDNDASLSTLQMLTNIEAKLDEYFSIIETMPTEFVEQAEKAKEKERRQRAREEKLEQQKREQERRVQRSLERAQAPVMKKTGKPVMFRSHVVKKKVVGSKNVKKNDEEAELEAFLGRV